MFGFVCFYTFLSYFPCHFPTISCLFRFSYPLLTSILYCLSLPLCCPLHSRLFPFFHFFFPSSFSFTLIPFLLPPFLIYAVLTPFCFYFPFCLFSLPHSSSLPSLPPLSLSLLYFHFSPSSSRFFVTFHLPSISHFHSLTFTRHSFTPSLALPVSFPFSSLKNDELIMACCRFCSASALLRRFRYL